MTEPITTCPACELQVPVGSPFCPHCGVAVRTRAAAPPVGQAPASQPAPWSVPDMRTPRPPRPQRGGPPWPVVITAGIVVLALIGVGALFLVHRQPVAAAPVATTTNQAPVPTTDDQPTVTTTTTEVPTTAPTPAQPTDENSAQAALLHQRAADKQAVEALSGSWVPELSAKTPGLVANGVTYDYLRIWADYQQQAAAYPGALLLNSSDFSTFSHGGYWVTVVPQTSADAAGANAWCDSAGIDANDCYAKLLSHGTGPHGSTVLRQ